MNTQLGLTPKIMTEGDNLPTKLSNKDLGVELRSPDTLQASSPSCNQQINSKSNLPSTQHPTSTVPVRQPVSLGFAIQRIDPQRSKSKGAVKKLTLDNLVSHGADLSRSIE